MAPSYVKHGRYGGNGVGCGGHTTCQGQGTPWPYSGAHTVAKVEVDILSDQSCRQEEATQSTFALSFAKKY